jgi:hypothetical protein
MKVKIGPYIHWWGPYQIIGLLKHIGFSKSTTDNWAKKSPDWFTTVCQWVHNKRKRKVKVHIDGYDVWSMDTTLAAIVLPMLKILKEKKHGIPISPVMSQTSNSAQSSFAFYAENDDLAFKAGELEWDIIIDKMIWSFEQLLDDSWEEKYTIQAAELDMMDYPEDEGKLTSPVRWKIVGEYDWKGMKVHQARIQEGLLLFGTRFQSLWD